MQILRFIEAGGFVMWPLLLLCVACFAVIIERLMAFAGTRNSPDFVAKTVALAREGDFDAAQSACAAQRGPVAACCATILRHRGEKIALIERRVEETAQKSWLELEKFLPLLETTATIAPLLGLLGTLVGMIGTFNAIATARSRGNSDAILSGIGEALYATATGITLAVIAFVAYGFFTARLRRLTGEVEHGATQLLNVLQQREGAGIDT
jgi:biopolymer transport protein ExbB